MIHWVAPTRQRPWEGYANPTTKGKDLTAKTAQDSAQPFPDSYVQRCRAARRDLSAVWTPAVGDWVARDRVPSLLTEDQISNGDTLTADRSVSWLPRLDQLLALLNEVSPHTVLDCYKGDFACICFDEVSRRIADVVAETPELACLQAFLFIRAELAAQQSQQQ